MFGNGFGGVFGGSLGNPFEGLNWTEQTGWQQGENPFISGLSPFTGPSLGGAQPATPSFIYEGRSAPLGYGSRGAPITGAMQRYSQGMPQGAGAMSSPSMAGNMGWASPLPPGGIYGTAKWNNGSATDVFVRRGTPVYAPFDGTVSNQGLNIPSGPMGVPPGFVLQGANGYSMRGVHVQPVTQGPVRRGQLVGYVNDASMDMLGPYQGMPDGFQHADLAFSRGGGFSPFGGNLDARQVLQGIGYQGRLIQGQTRGPNMGGGMGMPGMGMPGMGGMGMMPGMGGMGGGMPPGMGMGMGGGMMQNPFIMQMMGRGGMPGFGGGGGFMMPGGGGGMGGFGGGGFGGY